MSSNNPGALVGDRVRCPFHGACFNVRTGDIEEYPGLDCLPAYKVKHPLLNIKLIPHYYHMIVTNNSTLSKLESYLLKMQSFSREYTENLQVHRLQMRD